MVTFDQLVNRAEATLAATLPRRVVQEIVSSTIVGLGFEVSETTGEVYDPAPKPVINYPTDRVARPRARRRR